MKDSNIALSTGEILLPAHGLNYEKWAVVACDQFTAEPDYWHGVEAFVGDAPSSLRIVLPEIYLEERKQRIREIHGAMRVYLGNAVGGAAVAALAVYSHTASLFGDGLARSMVSIAESKAALGFGDAFLRGVLCNFLVCLAVWMAAASKRAEGKVIALFFPILLFVLCGYEHCIANLYYLPAGAFAAAEYGMETTLTLAGCLKNLAAVTLGNLVGGAALGVGYRFAYLKE